MAIETFPFDGTKYFDTTESQLELIRDALESGHLDYLADAIQLVAKSRGMTQIAEEAGISRDALYEAVGASGGKLQPASLEKIALALGVKHSAAA